MLNADCPCGSGERYADCCRLLHQQPSREATAEQVMRSRYSAYVLRDIAYLRESWHPKTLSAAPKPGEALEIEWLGLRVLDHRESSDGDADVEFVAFFLDGGKIQQLRERSRFERVDGVWRYVDGRFLPPVKLSRNDPCCCGSGRKQKKCHPEC